MKYVCFWFDRMITKVPVCTVVTTNTLKIYFAGSAIFTFELSTRVPSEREEYILTNATSMEDLDSSHTISLGYDYTYKIQERACGQS